MPLAVLRSVIEAVDGEARAAYARDEESCGLLAGPAGTSLVDAIIPMKNRANQLHALDPIAYPRTARMYFDVDPLKVEREVRARAAAGHPVKVLYHSHLDAGAYFSATDAEAAKGGGERPTYAAFMYLVTSVRGGTVDDRKLFCWDEVTAGFVETPLAIVDG